ncbi:manganese efflux pump MntP [Bacillus subtilis]
MYVGFVYRRTDYIKHHGVCFRDGCFFCNLGMGMVKLRKKQIFYIGFIIGLFHVIMPLAGMAAGNMLSGLLGVLAVYIGGALLFVLGVQMLMASFKQSEERFMSPAGPGLLLFAIGVSLDSFSVGLSLGIYGSHPFLTITLFGLFSMMLTWLACWSENKCSHGLAHTAKRSGASY